MGAEIALLQRPPAKETEQNGPKKKKGSFNLRQRRRNRCRSTFLGCAGSFGEEENPQAARESKLAFQQVGFTLGKKTPLTLSE